MEVLRPRTLAEALVLRAEHPGALAIRGGTDVMVELNFDRARPEAILDLGEVAELGGWSRDDGTLRLGAGPHVCRDRARRAGDRSCRRSRRRREPSARRRSATAALSAATSPLRLPPATHCRRCSVDEAEVELASVARGTRRLSVREFLVGPKQNALEEDELIVAVLVRPSGTAQTFMKVGPRNAMVIAVCSLAVAADRERGEIRASFGSAGPVPGFVRVPLDEARSLPEVVSAACSPIDDVRGTAAYRRHALGVLAGRAVERCLAA